MSCEPRATCGKRLTVGLFVTCLVDFFRPRVGFAALRLLERAGYRVEVPVAQVCCGQPAWNNGAGRTARRIALDVLDLFENYDYVVAPSGSCAAMLRVEYPKLLATDSRHGPRAQHMAQRVWELTAFLTDVAGMESTGAALDGTVAFHDACSGLRDLGVHPQPRTLLRGVRGLELRELRDGAACCGFGGTFCVKFPEVSGAMVSSKVRDATGTGAQVLTGCELGCLLNIAGRAQREDRDFRVLHIAEILDAETDTDTGGIGR